MEANLRFINSIDTKLMYYTVVQKCFEYYLNLTMQFAWLINSYLAFFFVRCFLFV